MKRGLVKGGLVKGGLVKTGAQVSFNIDLILVILLGLALYNLNNIVGRNTSSLLL